MSQAITSEDVDAYLNLGFKRVGRKGMVFQKHYVFPEESVLDWPTEFYQLKDKYRLFILYESLVYVKDGVIDNIDVTNTKSLDEVEKNYLTTYKVKS